MNQTIGEIGIEENKGLLEIEKSAAIDNILNSRSGVFLKPVNGGYDENNVLERGSVIIKLTYLKSSRYKSFPFAYKTKDNKRKNPNIWAYSMNLSFGFRPVTIS